MNMNTNQLVNVNEQPAKCAGCSAWGYLCKGKVSSAGTAVTNKDNKWVKK